MEVAKHEHVTEASKNLHVAQSAISRQIFNLEDELGVDLFIREGRTIRLTPIGRIFLEQMERAMHVIDGAKQIVREYVDPKKGTIHIGFTTSLASYIMPTAIFYFRQQYPEVKFELNQASYVELVESVKKGKINMALVGPPPIKEDRIKSSILFTENIVALLPSNHPLATKSSIMLNELQNDKFVLFPKGNVIRQLIMDGCHQRGFQPNVAFEGEDFDTIKGLVSAGLGITLIPEVTIVDCLPRATVRVPISEPNLTRSVAAIISTERELLPTEKLFFQFMKPFFERIEDYQYKNKNVRGKDELCELVND